MTGEGDRWKLRRGTAMIQWETRADSKGRYRVHEGLILGKAVYRIERGAGENFGDWWYLTFWHQDGGFRPIGERDSGGRAPFHAQMIRRLKRQSERHFREHIAPLLFEALESTKLRRKEDPAEVLRLSGR
jgi:hypothetical protein